jgi:NADH dehydrogenase [ubiquinone] 1 alpha subcomplex assembly factor 7
VSSTLLPLCFNRIVTIHDNARVTSAPKLPLRLVLAPNATPASTIYTRLSTLAATPPAPSLSSSLSFDTTLPPSPLSTSSSTLKPPQTPAQSISPTLSRFDRLPVGSRMEISPASWEIARGVGKALAGDQGGAGLIVDYGGDKAFGRSWRVILPLPLSCFEIEID